MEDFKNPFNITKATDFSDKQINDYWVEMPNIRFFDIFKPTSPMPMIIAGGKGSGKTHIMRYFSYSLQKIRYPDNIVEGIKNEGYVGIYLLCSGLNSLRFNNVLDKDTEKMSKLFRYFMDLSLSQLLLSVIRDAYGEHSEFKDYEVSICEDILSIIDIKGLVEPKNLVELLNMLAYLQTEIDSLVNNYEFNLNGFNLNIRSKPGALTFSIPKILATHLPSMRNILFLYLVDEFDKLTEDQQKYINTLVSERQLPSSFKIGTRLYGIKTYATYGSDELIKEGAEFERLHLDALFRANEKEYRKFSLKMCARRLSEAGFMPRVELNPIKTYKILNSFFEIPSMKKFAIEQTRFIINKYAGRERPYIKYLKDNLEIGFKNDVTPGLTSIIDVQHIINFLRVQQYPLLEKTNIFLFYRDWSRGKNLYESARKIFEECNNYTEDKSKNSMYGQVLSHFQHDLMAQLLRDCDQKQRYFGIKSFINMSNGLPRNLLLVLKYIVEWSFFYGEKPFRNGKVSLRSQQDGVMKASNFFYEDIRDIGKDGVIVRNSITRLGNLFREIRFSDKPSECSLITFSLNLSEVSNEAERIIKIAENWSCLIRIDKGQRDRNTKRIDEKYQLNSMLSPRWDLPVYRRGAISIKSMEVNSIFDVDYAKNIDEVIQKRIDKMTAPYFGKAKNKVKRGKMIRKQNEPLWNGND